MSEDTDLNRGGFFCDDIIMWKVKPLEYGPQPESPWVWDEKLRIMINTKTGEIEREEKTNGGKLDS